MSETIDIVMPQLGQAMEFGKLVEWLVADGSTVERGQPIASIESDKATYEIEATASGPLHHIVQTGAEVPVGDRVAVIGKRPDGRIADVPENTVERIGAPSASHASVPETGDRVLASPRARERAVSLGLGIASVSPHRADGLVVEADVEKMAKSTVSGKASPVALPRLRRIAADRLARSWGQAPHFVQMVRVDAAPLLETAAALKQAGRPGSVNDLLIQAAAQTLSDNREINAIFRNGGLSPIGSIAIGLAVATDEGLAVPVLCDVERLDLGQIANSGKAMIAAAREGRMGPENLGPASLTISNLGAYGIAFGTPVLNLDEPILIFVGAAEERPVVREGKIVVGREMTLSICYDHRVVDGIAAARFSQGLKQKLESLGADHAGGTRGPQSTTKPELAERELVARSDGEGLLVKLDSAHHDWVVDEPASLGGTDTGPDPITYALGGLLSCIIVAFKLAANRRKIGIESVEGRLTATPKGKVEQVAMTLTVHSGAERSDIERLLKMAKAGCYVHAMLRPDLEVMVDLEIVRP